MPIYEYVCMECESHFEELVRNGEAIHCPDCEASNVRKQFSVFATHGTAEPTRPEPMIRIVCTTGKLQFRSGYRANRSVPPSVRIYA